MGGVREEKEKVGKYSTQRSHPQKKQKRQQQHNSQTSQATLSEFEARELIKKARSILEGY